MERGLGDRGQVTSRACLKAAEALPGSGRAKWEIEDVVMGPATPPGTHVLVDNNEPTVSAKVCGTHGQDERETWVHGCGATPLVHIYCWQGWCALWTCEQ